MASPKIKLKEGYWCNDKAKGFINLCKGNKMSYMSMVALDFPDLVKASFELGAFFFKIMFKAKPICLFADSFVNFTTV